MTPKPNPIPPFTPALVARFCRRLKRVGSCLLWQGKLHNQGYGIFNITGKRYRTNRVAYFLSRGVDPGDLDVCHTCDTPACCEPSHLFLGTRADNNQDAIQKGRTRHAKGAKHGRAKLTVSSVREIRNSIATPATLAKQFGISRRAIGLIRQRKRWTHVP
jgi:hypothetical protein